MSYDVESRLCYINILGWIALSYLNLLAGPLLTYFLVKVVRSFSSKGKIVNVRGHPFKERTSTTIQLQNKIKEYKESNSRQDVNTQERPRRRMRDSLIRVDLPFSSSPSLRDEYINVYGDIRIGKVIEDIDALAGSVAYKHCLGAFSEGAGSLPLTIVTASVDRIDLIRPLAIHSDVRLSGCVSFVGTSSMEVIIKIESMNRLSEGEWDLAALALFTMVARHPVLHTAQQVPSLDIATEQERLLFQASSGTRSLHSYHLSPACLDRRKKRRELENTSLGKSLPLPREFEFIHQTLSMDEKKIDGGCKMSQHQIASAMMCHPQERNIHNFIFGGWLMRQAFELASSLASIYCHDSPSFLSLDESTFKEPVPVGSLLSLNALVVYVERSIVRVKVTASIVDSTATLPPRLTNVFGFSFEKRIGCSLPSLMPTTYVEAIQYLEGKRKHLAAQEEIKEGHHQWVRWFDSVTTCE